MMLVREKESLKSSVCIVYAKEELCRNFREEEYCPGLSIYRGTHSSTKEMGKSRFFTKSSRLANTYPFFLRKDEASSGQSFSVEPQRCDPFSELLF